MKSILMSLALMASSTVFSYEVPIFNGVYEFNAGATQVVQLQHHIYLRVGNAESKAELNQLIENKYTCVFQGQSIYKCVQFIKDFSNTDVADQMIQQKYLHAQIHFEKTHYAPELVNEGEVIQEWQLIQKIDFLLQDESYSYDKVQYVINDDVVKLKLQSKQNETQSYFYVPNVKSGMPSTAKIYLQDSVESKQSPASKYQLRNFKKYLYEVVWSATRH